MKTYTDERTIPRKVNFLTIEFRTYTDEKKSSLLSIFGEKTFLAKRIRMMMKEHFFADAHL